LVIYQESLHDARPTKRKRARTFQSDLMHETLEIIQCQNEGHMLDVYEDF